MPRFFADEIQGETARITGEDAAHIARVLRMQPGEPLTVCDGRGFDYACEITRAAPACVELRVLEKMPTVSEPTLAVTLFQGLPKADKMEWIVQKSVELGVTRVVPVVTARCVSRPDTQALARKTERWGKIAREAAGQSGRGILPGVLPAVSFAGAVAAMAALAHGIVFYEKCRAPLAETLAGVSGELGILIGPEGGLEEDEARLAAESGLLLGGLGPRILRTETAPLCALSAVMFATGNL